MRLPVMETGDPHEWPPAQSRKHFEPSEKLLANEKVIRFAEPMSIFFERRKTHCQAWKLPAPL